jgi:cytochrome c553
MESEYTIKMENFMKKSILVLILYFPLAIYALGDAALGKTKSAICAACHGADGVSVNVIWPNIAGQHTTYIVKQLQNFKQGHDRNIPLMTSIVATLSEKDMDDLAVYYSQLKPFSGKMMDKYKVRGEQLYRAGDIDKLITACIACHGPKAVGNAYAGFPRLAGQHAEYTILQLQAFKEGKRANDLQEIMRDISGRMSQDDIESIAHYLEGL